MWFQVFSFVYIFRRQTFKMISQVESFLCCDEHGTPEEGRKKQRLKRCISTNDNKDKDNSPKNYTQNIILIWYKWFI